MRTILIPAAGAGMRMRGADKLLERVDGAPLLRRQALAALATGARVLVTLPRDLPDRHEPRLKALAGLAVEILTIDASEGMSASLRAGAGAATGALMVLPADMPELRAGDLEAVWAAAEADPRRIWRGASFDGRPGHPVVFPAAMLRELAVTTGDAGGRAVISRHGAGLVALPADRAILDLDTPEDWADWRRRRD